MFRSAHLGVAIIATILGCPNRSRAHVVVGPHVLPGTRATGTRVTGTRVTGTHPGVVAQFQVVLDDLLPNSLGKPIFE